MKNKCLLSMVAGAALLVSSAGAKAQSAGASCPVTYQQLQRALKIANNTDHTGFDNHSWGVVVDRTGVVCAVAYSGPTVSSQWLGSRQIAAAKAFTANAFSLDRGVGGTAELSTAQLYQFVQPSNPSVGNPLYALNGGNVQDATLVYAGTYANFGTPSDPLVGLRVGGTITFGGGLALYNSSGKAVGGLGLSGDTACADHSTAWRTRIGLNLQPASPTDQLPFATEGGNMQDGHPHCPNDGGTQGATGGTAAMAKN